MKKRGGKWYDIILFDPYTLLKHQNQHANL